MITIGLCGVINVVDLKNNFSIQAKVEVGEGLGGGCLVRQDESTTWLMVNSIEGRILRYKVNDVGESDEFKGA